MTLSTRSDRPQRDSDILPYDDGQPMETKKHFEQLALLIQTLVPYLQAQAITAYVAGNNFLYYQRGNPPKFCGPDFYVVLGRQETGQLSYVVWEEDNRFPDVIIELLSPSTEKVDRRRKFNLYQDHFATSEYYLYDPHDQRLEGYRLHNGVYRSIEKHQGTLECQTLGLRLVVRGKWLRWLDPQGAVLPTGSELADSEQDRADDERARADEERARADEECARADEERARADEERARADEERARADEERARAEEERARAEEERARADEERARAEEERAQAEEERTRAELAEAEVVRLGAELQRLSPHPPLDS